MNSSILSLMCTNILLYHSNLLSFVDRDISHENDRDGPLMLWLQLYGGQHAGRYGWQRLADAKPGDGVSVGSRHTLALVPIKETRGDRGKAGENLNDQPKPEELALCCETIPINHAFKPEPDGSL